MNVRDGYNTSPNSQYFEILTGMINAGGNGWYVDSGAGSNSYDGKSWDTPVATIDYAIGLASANNGDVIFIAPGHAETLASATALVADKAGIKIIGLGEGNDRPKITIGTLATATIVISAASVTIKNIIVIGALDGLNSTVTITGDDCYIDIEYRDTSAAVESNIAITATSVDRAVIKLNYIGFIAGNAVTNAIVLDGCTSCEVSVIFYGVASTAIVEFLNNACHNINIKGYFYNSGTTDLSKNVIDTPTGSTWSVAGFDGAAGCGFSGGSGAAVQKDDSGAIIALIGALTNTGGTATLAGILGDPSNVSFAVSLAKFGTLVNTGGTATLGGILGDVKNIALADQVNTGIKKTTIADGTTIPNNTQAAAGLLCTATGGDILIEEIIWQRAADNFVGPTNYELSTDNVAGLTGAAAPNGVAILAKFNANKTGVLSIDGTTKQVPFVLESTKKLYIHGDDAATSAGGSTDFYIRYRRLAAGAYLA